MNQHEEIINKIKAAMRLARRAGTDGEKTAAENAARRLAAKAGVSLEEIEVTDAEIRTEAIKGDKWFVTPGVELGYVSAVLRQHFGVVLMQERFDRHTRLVWIGTSVNIAVAQYVYKILMRESGKAWREARAAKTRYQHVYTNHPGRNRQLEALRNLNKRAFLDGWFFEIHRKLTENPLRNDREQFIAEKKSADEFLERLKAERDIQERKGNANGNRDALSVRLGLEAAEKISLNRPCDGKGYSGSPASICGTLAIQFKG